MVKKIIQFVIIIGLIAPINGQPMNGKKKASPVLKSLLMPGMGEYALKSPKRGKIFFLTEVAFAFSAVSAFYLSEFHEDAYIAFAVAHSGAISNGKDHRYWFDIGNYESLDDYNQEHLRFREMDALYEESEEWMWNWDSTENRIRFENTRIKSDKWKLGGKFLIGGMVVNHVVSAIDAFYLTKILPDANLSIKPTLGKNDPSLSFHLTWGIDY